MINRRQTKYILLISLIVIIVATLWPFNFITDRRLSLSEIIDRFYLTSHLKDYIRNTLLFIPWGISLAASTNSNKYSAWRIVVINFIVAAILSSNIELIQILLPSRYSCLTDIVFNSIGGALGACLYCGHSQLLVLFRGIITNDYRLVNLRFVLTIIVGYCSIVTAAVWLLVANVSLDNWDDDYYLAIGSEVNGKIGWQGYITSLYISDRDLNYTEIARAFSDSSFFTQLPSAIASFDFMREQQAYRDSNNQLPELVWHYKSAFLDYKSKDRYRSQDRNDRLGIEFDHKTYLKTKKPAGLLGRRIEQSDRFTISITVAARRFDEVGPARIVSFAKNQFSRNVIIGQEGRNLILLLRTTTTGKSASKPTFIVPNVFSDRAYHQILITYANRELNFYIDRRDNQYTYKFLPATSIPLYLPWYLDSWNVNLAEVNIAASRATFYGIVLLPLAILIRASILCWNRDRLQS